MSAAGVVREWHSDDGWGVIDSAVTPGGCWVSFGSVLMPGYRSLVPGAAVAFEFEDGPQDGFAYRATAVWTGGARPEPEPGGPSAAYHSTLRLEFDDPRTDP